MHILCSENKIISFKETLSFICKEGSMELAILFLTREHLLPSVNTPKTLEAAGNQLSHRYASRPGDDVVIWSLLSGATTFNSAEALWKSRISGREGAIKTGCLMSSAPRLGNVKYLRLGS